MQRIERRVREQGATALIVVIFSILLLATISLGFMRLVIQDQNRSVDSELSRGAYDSALAGVEDGKRVLEACQLGNAPACAAITADTCTTVSDVGLVSLQNHEVKLNTKVGTTSADSYDQAYTCVKITPDTPDYQGTLAQGDSRVIPLDTTGSFNTLSLLWFKKAGVIPTIPGGASLALPKLSAWASTTPPLMRVQLMMYQKNGYKVVDFGSSSTTGTAGTNTLYLYPKTNGSTGAQFAIDGRSNTGNVNVIVSTKCDNTRDTIYFCKIDLKLPQTVTAATSASGYTAYLRVTSLYGSSDFSVQPSGTNFASVQPSIDSTGRASDIFSRVNARVERINQADAQLYPRATLDVTSNICKVFGVTTTNYYALQTCDYTGP